LKNYFGNNAHKNTDLIEPFFLNAYFEFQSTLQTNKAMNRLETSKKIALAFFIIGSILFLIHYLYPDAEIILIGGFYYVLAAIVINSFVLLALVVALCVDTEKEKTIQAIGIILLNVPIAALYT
jgi:hypothetical protein